MHSIRISILALSGLLIAPSSGRAQNIRMASSPTLSPNGATVAFTWNGDIWLAQTKGGSARQLTHHPAADGYPSFSPNGKYLAFSSSRSGSRQVHLMPYVGGQPKQLTAHTEGFTVEGWHPDGKRVLTSITRDHFWRHGERFHLVNLTNRGPEEVIFDGYGSDGNLSPDGKRLLFTREGERSWRKGYRGPRATQIWLYDLTAKKFTQLVAEDEESRWPLWKPDGKGFYYIAERGGVGNLRVRDLASGKESQLTQFEEDSVMYPTISKDGSTIVFRNLFDLWMFKTDGKSKPSKIALRNAADHTVIRKQRRTLKSATQISYSKDGLEVAFISGGDLWVMDTELREPVQITDTSSFEREPAFSPDGKSIFFVGERKGQPDIFRVARTDEKLFWWQNKKFRIAQLTKDAAEEDSLKISPSGGYIAFTKGRGDLWTMRPDGKEAKRLFESWNTPQFNWSPDSKWLVYAQSDNDFNRDIWIRPIDGSQKPYNLSRHPDNDSNPVWSPDGKTIAFTGRRRGDETDIYFAMLREEDQEGHRQNQESAGEELHGKAQFFQIRLKTISETCNRREKGSPQARRQTGGRSKEDGSKETRTEETSASDRFRRPARTPSTCLDPEQF
jgi:tricorn protease